MTEPCRLTPWEQAHAELARLRNEMQAEARRERRIGRVMIALAIAVYVAALFWLAQP